MTIDFQHAVLGLPKRIRAALRRGLKVSSDGFVATPDGPKHIDDMTSDELAGVVHLPWRIVIDTAEQQPFGFTGIRADAAQQYRPIQVETVRRCLGGIQIHWGIIRSNR